MLGIPAAARRVRFQLVTMFHMPQETLFTGCELRRNLISFCRHF